MKDIYGTLARNSRVVTESRLITRKVAKKAATMFSVGLLISAAIIGICDIVPTFKTAFNNKGK